MYAAAGQSEAHVEYQLCKGKVGGSTSIAPFVGNMRRAFKQHGAVYLQTIEQAQGTAAAQGEAFANAFFRFATGALEQTKWHFQEVDEKTVHDAIRFYGKALLFSRPSY